MGKFYDSIPDNLAQWIQKQEIFFVATAPLNPVGHVNVSPKGVRGTFHVESNTRCWYEDLSGSGVETISHLRENGRITIMFCAFEGAARISRLFGTGTVYEFGTPEYFDLIPPEKRLPGSRAAIVIDVYKASTSCGYAVPLYSFKAHRNALISVADKMEQRDQEYAEDASGKPTEELEYDRDDGEHIVQAYPQHSMRWAWVKMNQKSLDGLAGLRHAHIADAIPKKGILPDGPVDSEPPSDGTVEILGNRVRKETLRALLELKSKEEVVRLVLAVFVGIGVAAVYVQIKSTIRIN